MKGICLAGGGKKGAFQCGVLQKWLVQDQIEYEIFAGVSVGALNSAFLSQFPHGQQKEAGLALYDLWSNRVSNNAVKENWFGWYLASLWKPSVYSSKPLQNWVLKELDQNKITASNKKLRVISTCWNNRSIMVGTEKDENISLHVLSSSSYPVFLEPIEINGKMCSDGGLCEVTPLGELIRAGADDIDVIMCSNPYVPDNWDSNGKHVISYIERTLDIMSNQIMIADLKICGLKNDLTNLNNKYSNVKVRLVMPSKPLPAESLNFDKNDIKIMLEQGLNDATNSVQIL